MKRFYMYGHGGSHNHGCEAIVRSTIAMVEATGTEQEFVISSLDKAADEQFLPMEKITRIYPDSYTENKLLRKIYGACIRFLGDHEIVGRKTYKNFKKSLNTQPEDTVFLSIGGDNYCCERPSWLYYSNRLIDKKKYKRVLWGCSVEPETLSEEMIRDLNGYALITAREQITYELLREKLQGPQIVKVADMAFTIAKQDSGVQLPPKTVALNLSPIITKRGANQKALASFQKLVDHILANTEYHIAFIPHVNIRGNSDADTMHQMYERIAHTGRATMIGTNYTYAQLRHIISQCEMMVCARTHASISAYATCVPTLVIGYSVKSIGIATDLFGTADGYVLPMDAIRGGDELISAFAVLDGRKAEIRTHLEQTMAEYVKSAYNGVACLQQL